MELNQIRTEQRNPRTEHIDQLSTYDMVKLINQEDAAVSVAVGRQLHPIAKAVDAIAKALSSGGRLIYSGCGTSGRLGILDAVECPPTYSTDPDLVVGLIAGGQPAIFRAVEGAEDNRDLGRQDLQNIHFTGKDILVGLAASGRTPYVLGAMEYARECGATTVAVTCCPGSQVDQAADIGIAVDVGPEVITGSTRMKSGTAQKMVLNMLSTGAMIRLGKVYGNLMVDVKPSNEKLVCRGKSLVRPATGADEATAAAALKQCGYESKTAIVMIKKGVDCAQARALLAQAQGRVAAALQTP